MAVDFLVKKGETDEQSILTVKTKANTYLAMIATLNIMINDNLTNLNATIVAHILNIVQKTYHISDADLTPGLDVKAVVPEVLRPSLGLR